MVDGNGGKQKRFDLADLPEGIERAYAAGVNLTPETLQAELKPVPKTAAKVTVDGYACRGAAARPIRPLTNALRRNLQSSATGKRSSRLTSGQSRTA
jgi:hypothetical protein